MRWKDDNRTCSWEITMPFLVRVSFCTTTAMHKLVHGHTGRSNFTKQKQALTVTVTVTASARAREGAGWKGVLEHLRGLRASDNSGCCWVYVWMLGARGLGLVVHSHSKDIAEISGPWPWPWHPPSTDCDWSIMSSLSKSKNDDQYQTELCIGRNKAVKLQEERSPPINIPWPWPLPWPWPRLYDDHRMPRLERTEDPLVF
jgi:hypothetical protein